MRQSRRQVGATAKRATGGLGALRESRSPSLWTETQLVPPPLDRPPGSRILVLAPHMDDEALGCGGSLHRHVLAGESVTVAYLTDGRKGDPALNALDLPADERERREERLPARPPAQGGGAAARV